ncbi:unnamed protein product, partial [Meganyctiphanes norvegica]
LNWFDAKDFCANQSLRMAQPYDAIGLRSYMVQRYSNKEAPNYSETWLGARRKTSSGPFYWNNGNNTIVPLSSPLLYPFGVVNDCLLFLVNVVRWEERPEKPYSGQICEDKNLLYSPLC